MRNHPSLARRAVALTATCLVLGAATSGWACGPARLA